MTAAPDQAPDRCPRCGLAFACGAAGPAPCACAGITLSDAMRAELQAAWDGCLCMACLRELASSAS